MLAQRSVDDAAVEEDLGGVCNPAKDGDGVLELVVIVVSQRLNPGLDLLLSASVCHGPSLSLSLSAHPRLSLELGGTDLF